MAKAFSAAIRGKRIELTEDIDVTDLLLGGLLDRRVLTQLQYDQIRVRWFTVLLFCVYY